MRKIRKAKVKRHSSKPRKARGASAPSEGRAEKSGQAASIVSSPNLFLSAVLLAGLAVGAALSLFFPLDATDAGAPAAEIRTEAAGSAGITVIDGELPFSQVHWHAKLRIVAAGSEVPVPEGLGIAEGNNVDNEASGAKASPIHTHSADGVLHVELVSPRENLDKTTLGYFFNRVWGKKFGSECVLEYCNGPGGVVKLFVNGKPGEEFENYSIRDGDEILITYELE